MTSSAGKRDREPRLLKRRPNCSVARTSQAGRRVRSTAVWGIALGALGALYVALYPSMSGLLEQYLQQASENMQQFFGGQQGPLTIERWLEIEFIGSIIPIALPFLAMNIGARAVAGAEERKTLDLLLSNPVPRRDVVLAALVNMAGTLATVLVCTWVLTIIAAPAAGVALPPGRLAWGLLALWPFCLFFGALALLCSTLFRRSFLALAVPGVVLVAMYVVAQLAQASRVVEPLRVLSLFYHLGRPLEGEFPWLTTLGLLVAVAAMTAAAVAGFARRDIQT